MLRRQQHTSEGLFSVGAIFQSLILLALLVGAVRANTEKTIFLGPPLPDDTDLATGLPPSRIVPGLSSLHRISPGNSSSSTWRTHLPSTFAWADHAVGKSTTWILLDSLAPGQRYELRVCWAATQPTEFDLETFSVRAVQETPALAESLASFVNKYGKETEASEPSTGSTASPISSTLLLRIVAYADYVASNRSLMHPDRVPPVFADVILDPYLGNVLPQSLVPTVGCVVVVAVTSVLLAQTISKHLRVLSVYSVGADKKNQ